MSLRAACALLLLAGVPSPALARRVYSHPQLPGATRARAPASPRRTPGAANCTTHWIEQDVDHFSWALPPVEGTAGGGKWLQRYLVYDGFWRNGSAGAVFFYTGNEGPVENYADHTGLMWENAEAAGALIVFAEHRYYGESQPFGASSPQYPFYLTHEQALADYAALIFYLQTSVLGVVQPVIAFGGSYGGKLSAWMRMSYPGVIAGAVAASAPVLAFDGVSPAFDSQAYWAVVTRDMTAAAGAAAACAANVRAAWPAIDAAAAADPARLQRTLHTCAQPASPQDVNQIKIVHVNAWDTAAMGNYPYASSYILGGGPVTLPAFPVRAMCEHLADPALATGDPWALLAAFDAAGAVFNNVSQTVACYSLPGGDIWLDGIWDVQYCTETLPEETYFTRDGVRDAFWPFAINRSATDAHCRAAWGVAPRWTAIARTYGGAHHGATRIAFSNGGYDPWSSGGVLPGSAADTPQTPAIFIPTGAHHVDLFFADPADPPEVTAARAREVALVTQWIADAREERRGGA